MKHHISAPQARNELPADIRNTATYYCLLYTFKYRVKTFLFSAGYGL